LVVLQCYQINRKWCFTQIFYIFAVEKSGIVDALLPLIDLNRSNSLFLRRTDAEDAKLAGGSDSGKCTLILTQDEYVKDFAVSCCLLSIYKN